MSVQLDRYFFPHQEVVANPEHDPGGVRNGSKISVHVGAAPIAGQSNTYAVEVTLSLDDEKSINPPYRFTLHAFGIWTTTDDVPADSAPSMATATGVPILIGAAREHLAAMTSRGPWGPFILGPIPLQMVPADPAQEPSGLPSDQEPTE